MRAAPRLWADSTGAVGNQGPARGCGVAVREGMSLERELRRVCSNDNEEQPSRAWKDDITLEQAQGEWWSPMPFGRDERRPMVPIEASSRPGLVDFIEPKKRAA